MISVQCNRFTYSKIILANTEANERRIRNVESCFGASGQVSFKLVYSPLSKRVENWGKSGQVPGCAMVWGGGHKFESKCTCASQTIPQLSARPL